MKPTDEQEQELWERCGFKVEICHDRYCAYTDKNHSHIYPPSKAGKKMTDYGAINNYPKLDLNNLFKYAVPKLIVYLMGYKTHDRISAIEWLFQEWLREYINNGLRDSALALFWSLYKALGGK